MHQKHQTPEKDHPDRRPPPGGQNLTLTSQATGTVTRLGRRLTGVYVRVPPRGAAQRMTNPGMRLP